MRTFRLDSDGVLWPVFTAGAPWTDGPNTTPLGRSGSRVRLEPVTMLA